LTCNDDAVVQVTTTVDDGVNPTATDSTTVTVNNATPEVGVVHVTPNPVSTGGTIALNAAFTDAGSNDTHVASINWGDSNTTAGTVTETNGSGTVTGSHLYAAPGTYHVTVTVTDDNGGAATSSIDVVVDGAPTVNSGGPYSGVEGAGVTLGANATDPDGDTLNITWSSNVTTAAPGTVCSFTGIHTLAPTLTCNDDAVVEVTITVSDGINPAVTATTTVTILNAVPAVSTPVATPNPAPTGSTVALSTAFTDPGVNDTHIASINWGDSSTTTGTVTETNGSGTVTGSHAYATAGAFTVTVTVNDKDGGVASGSATVVVNARPTASAGGPYSGSEGTPVTLHGTANDADGDTLGTSWGIAFSGGPGTSCTLTGATTLSPSVKCNDDATVTATLTVTDGVNTPATSAATVTVANVNPNVTAFSVPTSPVAVGTSFTVSGNFADAGTNDTHTATISWGDSSTSGGIVSETLGVGTVTASHAYAAPGTYNVSLTVTDDNGGTTTYTSTASVVAYSPSTSGWTAGAGLISSPSQAYTPNNTGDTNYKGTAEFAYLAVQPPSGGPAGATAFNLNSNGMTLVSLGVTSLTFNGSNKAYYLGSGYVNGVGGYSVLVSSVDGGFLFGDKFRIKIWNTATGAVLYDTQNGAADSAPATTSVWLGAIVVHT
jgi:hypothetical protein